MVDSYFNQKQRVEVKKNALMFTSYKHIAFHFTSH